MRAFNDRDKGNNACSYCRQVGHRATECAIAKYDYEEWMSHRVPFQSESWYTWKRHDYSHWIKEATRVAEMRRRKEEREAAKKAGTIKRAKSSCGFCGGEGHNRRNCEEMQEVLASAKRANASWKHALYSTLVKEHGICEGAAVKVKCRVNWSDMEEKIGLITYVNWNDINLLTSDINIDSDYRTDLKIKVNVDGETHTMVLKYGEDYVFEDKTVISSAYSYYNKAELVRVIGKSEKVFDDEWVTTAPEEEFTWLTKKRSLEWLRKMGILALIKKWDNLRY